MKSFGLKNTGVICYFNSLIQGLISCPSFVTAIEQEKNGADVAKLFLSFLRSIGSADVLTIVPILQSLSREHTFFGRQQEDASEGFDLLIDKLGPRIESMFTSKWRVDIYCDTCNDIVSRSSDTMNRLIMEKDYTPLYDNHDSVEAYMSANMSGFNDYKCTKCGCEKVMGMKIARLIEPPPIYIVSFNKFMKKWDVKYPTIANVRYSSGYDKVAQYKLVSVVRHFGGRNGGHYNATVVREDDNVYNVDDSNVSRDEFKCSSNDYILIYARL